MTFTHLPGFITHLDFALNVLNKLKDKLGFYVTLDREIKYFRPLSSSVVIEREMNTEIWHS